MEKEDESTTPRETYQEASMDREDAGLPARRDSELTRQETVASSLGIRSSLQEKPSLAQTMSRVPTATKAPSFSLFHEVAYIAVVSSAQLMTQAALAQSIAPLHVIGRTLNTTNHGQLSWLAAGFSLTVGTFILPAGRWGDLYGHKRLFTIGYFWFALWSLIAGFTAFSHNLIFFAFCRGMQGLGPASESPRPVEIPLFPCPVI